MSFITDRKRVDGLGSAKDGTEHAWRMKLSSIGLTILVPLFIFTFGAAYGGSYEDVLTYYSSPFPALVAALTLTVGWLHFKDGVQVLIEDYTHGLTRTGLIVAMTCLSYAMVAASLYAIVRLAL
ncbi:succinate dehydrogenase, hydrophobic membrane anchor protein [Pontivivens insulae]|uniref:Succinate dehydrogenase hydrophobic membrane anchor subunit n=1 Tax=Pontivivens insulae TaxID=1639689 RepID=A0A2R8ADH8_9RHOB|nr:succinate dehydrogenase, hydrophobic membrane anchor protein [Pontivivens insulae]RED14146.1 succinate dehydrogenase subunit D [Pontivivens insulae]SPF30222.1 hypothetical protein POI8812_02557 [Pontivivens insulae]